MGQISYAILGLRCDEVITVVMKDSPDLKEEVNTVSTRGADPLY